MTKELEQLVCKYEEYMNLGGAMVMEHEPMNISTDIGEFLKCIREQEKEIDVLQKECHSLSLMGCRKTNV